MRGLHCKEATLQTLRKATSYLGFPQENHGEVTCLHVGYHLKSSTLTLYTKQKEGGQGLVSVQDEAANIQYIRKMAITGHVLSQYLRQQKLEKEEEQGEESSFKAGQCMLPPTSRQQKWLSKKTYRRCGRLGQK